MLNALATILGLCALASALGLSTLQMATTITPGAIVGGGRIGSQIFETGAKKDVFLSSRQDKLPADFKGGPIYVCTRNNDLEAIIDATPDQFKADLVFVQNGMLADFLASKGLQDNTQALVYYAVAAKGEPPIDGKTDLAPEGLTAATGKWAADLQARLQGSGLTCHVLETDAFKVRMLEKHVWICAFMAVGAKHSCTVGEVESSHSAEVRALIAELAAAAAKKEKVTFPEGLEDRLCAYARAVAHFPTALKEFEWRNGWFAEYTLDSVSRMLADPCPLHTGLLGAAPGLLLRRARKALIEKKKRNAVIDREYHVCQREMDEYNSYVYALRKKQRAKERRESGETEEEAVKVDGELRPEGASALRFSKSMGLNN